MTDLQCINPIGLDGVMQGAHCFMVDVTEVPEPQEDTPRASPASHQQEYALIPAFQRRGQGDDKEEENAQTMGDGLCGSEVLDEMGVLDAGDEPMTRPP